MQVTKAIAFNYGCLADDVRDAVQQHAQAIHGLLARTASQIVEIGVRLRAVREQIPDRFWGAWIRMEFNWSSAHANRLMRCADRFAGLDCLDNFRPSVLYELLHGNADPSVIDEAVQRARAGETIGHAAVLEIKSRHSDDLDPEKVKKLSARVRHVGRETPAQHRPKLAGTLRNLADEIADPEEGRAAQRPAGVVATMFDVAICLGTRESRVALWKRDGMPGEEGNYSIREIVEWLKANNRFTVSPKTLTEGLRQHIEQASFLLEADYLATRLEQWAAELKDGGIRPARKGDRVNQPGRQRTKVAPSIVAAPATVKPRAKPRGRPRKTG